MSNSCCAVSSQQHGRSPVVSSVLLPAGHGPRVTAVGNRLTVVPQYCTTHCLALGPWVLGSCQLGCAFVAWVRLLAAGGAGWVPAALPRRPGHKGTTQLTTPKDPTTTEMLKTVNPFCIQDLAIIEHSRIAPIEYNMR